MSASIFFIVGNIDQSTVASLIKFRSDLLNANPAPSKLTILISSLGGDVGAAIASYNIIKSIDHLPIETHNIGEVTSAANIIYLAADTRLTCAKSYFRHHGTFYQSNGNLHRVAYEDILETMKTGEKIMTDIIVERTRLTAEDVAKYFRSPLTINADEALRLGIATAIEEIA
ncbi:MAG TPA: ATP-dependent Clp protease proteolytic subunit [Pseudolabrys sp.]|nr:ATP-dependent Clp protease proteolytic subunit [Pseudolabrys sp.]